MQRNFYLRQYHKGTNFSAGGFDPNTEMPGDDNENGNPENGGYKSKGGKQAGDNTDGTGNENVKLTPDIPYPGWGFKRTLWLRNFKPTGSGAVTWASLASSGASGFMEGRGGFNPTLVSTTKYLPYAGTALKFGMDMFRDRGRRIDLHLMNAALNAGLNLGANKLGKYVGSKFPAQPEPPMPQQLAPGVYAPVNQPMPMPAPMLVPQLPPPPAMQQPAVPMPMAGAAPVSRSFSRPVTSFLSRKFR